MKIIVSDASIIFDLSKFSLIDDLFDIGYEIQIPIFIYNELKRGVDKASLIQKGIVIAHFEGEDLIKIQQIRDMRPRISFPDASGIYLANKENAILLTADQAMYNTAIEISVTTYRTLWLVKQVFLQNQSKKDKILSALTRMKTDPQCRIPDDKIDELYKEIIEIASV